MDYIMRTAFARLLYQIRVEQPTAIWQPCRATITTNTYGRQYVGRVGGRRQTSFGYAVRALSRAVSDGFIGTRMHSAVGGARPRAGACAFGFFSSGEAGPANGRSREAYTHRRAGKRQRRFRRCRIAARGRTELW